MEWLVDSFYDNSENFCAFLAILFSLIIFTIDSHDSKPNNKMATWKVLLSGLTLSVICWGVSKKPLVDSAKNIKRITESFGKGQSILSKDHALIVFTSVSFSEEKDSKLKIATSQYKVVSGNIPLKTMSSRELLKYSQSEELKEQIKELSK